MITHSYIVITQISRTTFNASPVIVPIKTIIMLFNNIINKDHGIKYFRSWGTYSTTVLNNVKVTIYFV